MESIAVQVEAKDLALVADNLLNDKQLKILLGKTPDRFIKQRPAKGGGTWDYVSTAYVQKVLNMVYGWRWSFEIVKQDITERQVVVQGRLTFTVGDESFAKMQFGRKDIMFSKGTTTPMDIGNDLKAAASDALKKCASMIGIAQDIYGKEDFKEIEVVPTKEENEEELVRILKHIATSETLNDLKMVEDFIETRVIREVYNAKLAQMTGTEK